MTVTGRQLRTLVFLVVGATVFLRLASLAWIASREPENLREHDSFKYERPALALLEIGRFSCDPARPAEPEVVRTPGYPVFIAAVYAVVGRNAVAVIVAQILLSAGTLLITWRLAARRFDEAVAAGAVAVAAVDPISFFYSQVLLTETVFTFLVVAALFFVTRWFDEPGRRPWSLAAGVALALAAHVRPLAYYLIVPVVAAFVAGAIRRRLPARVIAAGALAPTLPWIVLVGGWQLRNQNATGSPRFSQIASVSLLDYRAAGIAALRDGVSLEEGRRRIHAELPEMTGWPQARVFDAYRSVGLRVIAEHPFLGMRTQIAGVARTLFSSGLASVHAFTPSRLSSGPMADLLRLPPREYVSRWIVGAPLILLLYALVTAATLCIYGAFCYGVVRVIKNEEGDPWWHAVILGTCAYLLLLPAGPESYARFRVPVMPLVAVYAAYGFSVWRPRHRPRPATGASGAAE